MPIAGEGVEAAPIGWWPFGRASPYVLGHLSYLAVTLSDEQGSIQ